MTTLDHVTKTEQSQLRNFNVFDTAILFHGTTSSIIDTSGLI